MFFVLNCLKLHPKLLFFYYNTSIEAKHGISKQMLKIVIYFKITLQMHTLK